jgi:hypothetical protein
MGAFLAESAAREIPCSAAWTSDFQLACTLITELGVGLIFKLARRTFHPETFNLPKTSATQDLEHNAFAFGLSNAT